MARLARLVLPGQAHHIIQRGHGVQPVFTDASDRNAFLAALHEAAAVEKVSVHAYALGEHEVQLLATPAAAAGLSRWVQAVGRRYVSGYNRRHRLAGTLWDGRFRCAVVEPGVTRLDVLRLIDGQAGEAAWTSAAHRCGERHEPRLLDPPEYWALGNTPFEREAAYRTLLQTPLPPRRSQALRDAALGGWVAGSPAFAAQVAQDLSRPTLPRPRGRPRRGG